MFREAALLRIPLQNTDPAARQIAAGAVAVAQADAESVAARWVLIGGEIDRELDRLLVFAADGGDAGKGALVAVDGHRLDLPGHEGDMGAVITVAELALKKLVCGLLVFDV